MISEVFVPMLVWFVYIVTRVLIVQFVLGLLISFNVVNFHNKFVSALWQALAAILDPILNPIRKRMPHSGPIDLSPLVLIFGLQFVILFLDYLSRHYA